MTNASYVQRLRERAERRAATVQGVLRARSFAGDPFAELVGAKKCCYLCGRELIQPDSLRCGDDGRGCR